MKLNPGIQSWLSVTTIFAMNIVSAAGAPCGSSPSQSLAINVAFGYANSGLELNLEGVAHDATSMKNWASLGTGIPSARQIAIGDETIDRSRAANPSQTSKNLFLNLLRDAVAKATPGAVALNYSGHGTVCLCDDQLGCLRADPNSPDQLASDIPDEARKRLKRPATRRWCLTVPPTAEEKESPTLDFSTLVSDFDLKRAIPGVNQLIVDACHAGEACRIDDGDSPIPLLVFAAALSDQLAPSQAGGGILWNALDQLASRKADQCQTDFNGDGMISEEEAAMFVTVRILQCSQRGASTDSPTYLRKSLTTSLSKTFATEELEFSDRPVPAFKASDRCLFRIASPAVCSPSPEPSKSRSVCEAAARRGDQAHDRIRGLLKRSNAEDFCSSASSSHDLPKGRARLTSSDHSATGPGALEPKLKEIRALWQRILGRFRKEITRACSTNASSAADCKLATETRSEINRLSQDLDQISTWVKTPSRGISSW